MRDFRKLLRYQGRLERKQLRCNRKKGKPMCCGGLIFGVLIVLWGISLILNVLFHISIPVFGILIGVFLVYLGINVMTGGFKKRHHCSHSSCSSCSTAMGKLEIKVDDDSLDNVHEQFCYRTVFGKATIDLRPMTEEKLKGLGEPLVVNIATVFGRTDVKLSRDIPVRIFVSGAFGNTLLPDSNSVVFGSHTYNSHGIDNPLMVIYISTVFGLTEVKSE